MEFSLIIPNYNGAQYLEDCLDSIKTAQKHSPRTHLEIILSDNASTDDSLQVFKKYSSKFIVHAQNLGFGQAINLAVKIATHPYIIITNNDIKFHPNWFNQITLAIHKFPSATCYYGLVLNRNGKLIESTGFQFFPGGKVINLDNGQPYSKQKTYRYIWGAPASLLVIKKDIFQKIGGFDPDYFAYIEDVDLAYRLNKQGYKTLFVPKAISYHLGGATSQKMGNLRSYMTLKNWFLFIKKNYSASEIFKYFPQIFIQRLRDLKYYLTQTSKMLLYLIKFKYKL